MFNALNFTKMLEQAGVPRQQAEAHVQMLAAVVESELATKSDLLLLRKDIKELEYRLTIKLSTIVGAMLTLMGVVNALVHS